MHMTHIVRDLRDAGSVATQTAAGRHGLGWILTRVATKLRLRRFIGSAIDGQGSTAQQPRNEEAEEGQAENKCRGAVHKEVGERCARIRGASKALGGRVMPKCRQAIADALARLIFEKPLAELDRS